MIYRLQLEVILISVLLCGGYIGLIALIASRFKTRISGWWFGFLLVFGMLEAYFTLQFCTWYSNGYFLFYGREYGRVSELYLIFASILCFAPYLWNDRRLIFLASLPLLASAVYQFYGYEPLGISGISLFAVLAGISSAANAPVPTAMIRIIVLVYKALDDGNASPSAFSSRTYRPENKAPAFTGQFRQVQGGPMTGVPVKYLGIGIYQDAAGNRYKGGPRGKLKKY